MKANDQLAATTLNALKDALDGGNLYYFAGPVPADASDALNMGASHTQCVMLTESNDGVSGLTFDTATGPSLSKAASEEWTGTVQFDGADDADTTLTPTFFRMGEAGDDCRGAGAGPRIQGTIGGPSSSADIKLGDGTTLTANGTNTRSLPIFSVDQLFLG